jgi:signal transduction histidine kinase
MKLRVRLRRITLRVRLLSLTLSMVAIVALTLICFNLNTLVAYLLQLAAQTSEMTSNEVQSFILRHAQAPSGLTVEQAKQLWMEEVAQDADLAALLEQAMAESRSIVEINIADGNGIILASSNPRQVNARMEPKQDLSKLQEAGPLPRMVAIFTSNQDYETRKQEGVAGQTVFTVQVLMSPIFLRGEFLPAIRQMALWSGVAMLIACLLAYWSANIALRPLTRISQVIDDIASGKSPPPPSASADDARELAIIESKLSLLGERFRGAQEDASQLRSNLEGVLEKLDAGTRQTLEQQIALARRLTAINSLTGRVAHEIKNPLNSIALRLEMLRSRIADESPDVEPEFAILSEEVTRLDRVVRTFLDFNRPVELVLEDVDVGESAAEIVKLIDPEAAQKGIDLSFDRPPESVTVKGDKDLLKQAFLNIAVNAIEAMPEGGRLSIEVEKNRSHCLVGIRDTGPGIPREQREKIFQLYFTTKPRGTGIGLAMTFRAVQLHGGTIEIESECGKGTTFRVTLPLAEVNRVG